MRNAPPRAIGILAGGGNLPIEIAASLKARGTRVKVIAIRGESDASLDRLAPTYVYWGQIGRLIKTLKTHGCDVLVIVGTVRRPDLGAIKPDLGFFKAIPTVLRLVGAGGDDALLRGVIEFFQQKGIAIVGPDQIAPELVVANGAFCEKEMTPQAIPDVALGFAAIRAMAPFDIGQSVIVTNGSLETLEDADGTDAMLARASSRRRLDTRTGMFERPAGVLVKRPKPGQDMRVDLPVIGPATAMKCAQANLAGIAVEAGKVLAIDREAMKAFANGHGLFIEGVREDAIPEIAKSDPAQCEPLSLRVVGRVRVGARTKKDAITGGQLIGTLETFDYRSVAIVSRGHVLTVDDSENRTAAIVRSQNLRQWGDRRWRAKIGVAVLSAGRDADEQTIHAAARAGLACIAVRLNKFDATVSAPMIKLANQNGIAIVEVYPGEQH